MDDFILWCGFVGAWALVAGPVYQATLELGEEDDVIERVRAAWSSVPQRRVSAWWWLVPPVALVLRHRRRNQFRDDLVSRLSPEEHDALSNFVNKAAGWQLVGLGGFLLAVRETWGISERYALPLAVFWVLVAAMGVASLGYAAGRSGHTRREREARKTATGTIER